MKLFAEVSYEYLTRHLLLSMYYSFEKSTLCHTKGVLRELMRFSDVFEIQYALDVVRKPYFLDFANHEYRQPVTIFLFNKL